MKKRILNHHLNNKIDLNKVQMTFRDLKIHVKMFFDFQVYERD